MRYEESRVGRGLRLALIAGLPGILLTLSPPVPGEPEGPRETAQARFPLEATRPASAIFKLVEELSGLPVRPRDPSLDDVKVQIGPETRGQRASLEDVTLLLGAHRLFLFRDQTPAGAPVWIATRNRHWRPADTTPAQTRVFRIHGPFEPAILALETYLEDANRHRPPETPPAWAFPLKTRKRVAVSAPSKKILDGIPGVLKKAAPPAGKKGRAGQRHLYVYSARDCRAADLLGRLPRFLTEEETRRVQTLIPRGTNAIWVRTHPVLWEKVEKVLRVLDGWDEGLGKTDEQLKAQGREGRPLRGVARGDGEPSS